MAVGTISVWQDGRVAQKQADGTWVRVSHLLRDDLWKRDEGTCGICGEPVDREDFHVDHIRPIAFGGSDCIENLQLAHPVCNLRKGSGHAGVTRQALQTIKDVNIAGLPDDVLAPFVEEYRRRLACCPCRTCEGRRRRDAEYRARKRAAA